MSMTFEQIFIVCIGLTFLGIIAAVVISFKVAMNLLIDNNKDLMKSVDSFVLTDLALKGSELSGNPMVGPATIQQLAKLREAENTIPPEGTQIERGPQPRTGVTISQKGV